MCIKLNKKVVHNHAPKIFIITPSLSGGGAEKIALNLVKSYTAAGADVAIVAFNTRGQYRALLDDSIKIFDLGVSEVRYVLPRLVRLLKKEKPTHILSVIRGSNIFVGLSLLFDKRVRVVFREANTMDGVKAMPCLKRLVYKSLMIVSYWRANKIIANSNDTKDDLVNNNITNRRKVAVIGNPVLPDNFSVLSQEYMPEESWFGDPRLKVVLSVGRLHPQKNHVLLLDAFAVAYNNNNELRLIILGEGDEKNNIENKICRLGLSKVVKVVDFKLNPFPYYKYADLFVLSSNWEGFGNVIVEALACGTPVVSTDCPGGPKEILENGRFGTLVPVADVPALANAILFSLAYPVSESAEIALKNRAKQYSVQSIGARYMQEIQ